MSGAALRNPPKKKGSHHSIDTVRRFDELNKKIHLVNRKVELLDKESIKTMQSWLAARHFQVALIHEVYLKGRLELLGKACELTWLPPSWWLNQPEYRDRWTVAQWLLWLETADVTAEIIACSSEESAVTEETEDARDL